MRCSPARLAKTTADTGPGHRGRARAHSPPRTPRTAPAHRLRATRLRAPRSPSPGLALWTAPRIRPPAVAVRCQPPTHPQPIDRNRIACCDTSPATRIDGLFFLFSCSAVRLPPRASQARNSRAQSAPSPRRSSVGATAASQRRPSHRRSPAPNPNRPWNLVQNPALADPPREKGHPIPLPNI